MSLNTLIPEIWAGELLMNLNDSLVFSQIARDYSPQLANGGNTIHLGELLDVTISTYTKNSTETTSVPLQSADKQFTVDQFKYFAFYMEDIDKAQVKSFNSVMNRAREQSMHLLRKEADTFLTGLYTEAGINVDTTASPASITSANVVEKVLECQSELSANNALTGSPFMIIPPWFAEKLALAGVVAASDSQATLVWRDGAMIGGGQLGFNMYLSNNISETSAEVDTRIMFGIENESVAFAQSVVEFEGKRHPTRMADEFRGLYAYGGKIAVPNSLGILHASSAAEA